MIYEYILNNYKEMEPIFVCDLPKDGSTKSALTQRLKTLCDQGFLCKYDNGIYYIPKKNSLNIQIGLNADTVARYKYVFDGKKVKGYYSGHTFANQIGLTTQVPMVVEIVSNNCSAKCRNLEISNSHFKLRKSEIEITSENVYALQLLDLLKNIDFYADDNIDTRDKVYEFVKKHNITKQEIDKYIRDYPVTIFKNYYEMELENVFAYR